MRKVMAAVIGAVVGLGGVAAAQAPLHAAQADRAHLKGQAAPAVVLSPDRRVLNITGNGVVYLHNVMFRVNGVTVRADRVVVVNGREAALDGNVRLTLPKSK